MKIQKTGHQKKLMRASRHRARNAAIRPAKIKRARECHIKNALRSCGAKFASALREYYKQIPIPSKKAG